MEHSTRKIFNFTGALLAAGLLGVYFLLDPEHHFFPKCPFLWLSGWKCPGCGSQRAVHHLLHADVLEALRVNFLFVLAFPYVLFGLILEYTAWGQTQFSIRRRWYGYRAALVALVAIVAFGIARNVWGF
ncbi:MAG: DUF2752 domain-containing protein [Saprospiraceae bacterium]|nr:DUF2752 domain-containing protein [Saprospiraceae bacterium]